MEMEAGLVRFRAKIARAIAVALEKRKNAPPPAVIEAPSREKKASFADEIESARKAKSVVESEAEVRVRQMEERQKAKMRVKREADKQESRMKKTRGILDIGSLFKDGKRCARDKITGVLRDVPQRAPKEAEASTKDAVDDDSDVEIIAVSMPTGGIEISDDDDAWVTAAAVANDPLLKRAFAFLISRPEIGCANQPECNAEACKHAADVGIAPLEDAWAAERTAHAPSRKIIRSFVPMNPFIGLQFPLMARLTKIDNTLLANDELLNQAVRNDDYVFSVGMSSLVPSFADVVIRIRRVYHAELVSLAERRDRHLHSTKDRIGRLLNVAIVRSDDGMKRELENEYNRTMETIEHEYTRSIAEMDSKFEEIIARDIQYATERQYFALPHALTVRAILELVHLRDGHHRSDNFYRELVAEIMRGHCDNLFAECDRERVEIQKKGAAEQFQHLSFTLSSNAQKQFSAEFVRRSLLGRPRTADEVRRHDAEQSAALAEQPDVPLNGTGDEEDGPIIVTAPEKSRAVMSREDIVRQFVASQKQHRSSTQSNGHVGQKRSASTAQMYVDAPVVVTDWRELAKWTKEVCGSQNTVEGGMVACTAIAFMAAFRFMISQKQLVHMNPEITLEEYVREFIPYDKHVDNGAKIWLAWIEQKNQPHNYMMANEVLQVDKKLGEIFADKENLVSQELQGRWPPNAVDGVSEDDVEGRKCLLPFDAALAKAEAEARDGQFAAVFTLRSSSLALARVGDLYYVFDSHQNSPSRPMAMLLCFESREILSAALAIRFPVAAPTVDDYAELAQKNEYSMLLAIAYYLYVMTRVPEQK